MPNNTNHEQRSSKGESFELPHSLYVKHYFSVGLMEARERFFYSTSIRSMLELKKH